MRLLPREVVVVLHIQQHLRAQMTRHVPMDHRMVGRRIPAHQLHGRPVLLALRGIQVQPGQVLERVRQLGVPAHGQLAVVRRHGRARPAAAAVAEQREVGPGGQPEVGLVEGQGAELHEVVAAAAGAQLAPRFVAALLGDRAHAPVAVHHLVLAPVAEGRAHAEAGLLDQRRGQAVLLLGQRGGRDIQHGQLHAAGDVHADRVRNDAAAGGQHAADGQAVALVRVGHQRPARGHRQLSRVGHLLQRARLQALAPDLVRSGRLAADEGVGGREILGQRARQRPVELVVGEAGRGADQRLQLGRDLAVVQLAAGRLLQQLYGQLHAPAVRDAHVQQLSRLHRFVSSSS